MTESPAPSVCVSGSARLFLALGASSAALSVAIGAAGAHALAGRLDNTQAWFHTALQYQQLHALGLLLLGSVLLRLPPSRWLLLSGGLLVAGTLLFSGNLYLRSLAGIDTLRVLIPAGGAAFILGWLAFAIGVVRSR